MEKSLKKWRFIQELTAPGKNPFYLVRIVVNRKVISTKHLEFELHGGKERAFKLAVKFRDAEIKRLGISDRTSANSPRSRNTRNQSGYMGVQLVKENNRGYISYAWSGAYSTVIDGESKRHQKKYSIKKYGYEKAFLLALKYRCDGTGEPVPKNPIIPAPVNEVKAWIKLNNVI